jgi:hypothetical protein
MQKFVTAALALGAVFPLQAIAGSAGQRPG